MASGYLYALANESLPDVLKVGCTSRNPFERAKELRTTGVPTPFYVVAAVFVPDIKKAEASAHTLLGRGGHRLQGDREFFYTTLVNVTQVFSQLVSEASTNPTTANAALTHEQVLADAKVYHYGYQETPPDLKKALKLYEQAVQLGSIEAAGILSKLYRAGNGVRKSPEKARYYWGRIQELEEQQWQTAISRTTGELRERLAAKDYYSAWLQASIEADVEAMKLVLPRLESEGYFARDQGLDLIVIARYFLPFDRKPEESETAAEWIVQTLEPLVALTTIGTELSEALNKVLKDKSLIGDSYPELALGQLRETVKLFKRRDPTGLAFPYDELLTLTDEQITRMQPVTDESVETLARQVRMLSTIEAEENRQEA